MIFHQLFVSAFIVPMMSFIFPFMGYQSTFTPMKSSGAGCERPAFEGSRISKTMPSASDTAVADLNGDGRLDLAIQSGPFQTLSVQFGRGNGYFGEPRLIDSASTGFYLVAADFNNDGNADLVTPAKIFLGDGAGGFSAPRLLLLGSNASLFQTGDFNGDDNMDLAGQIFSSRNIEVFYGDGTGRFSAATAVDMTAGIVEMFAAADLNGDGISDLAATMPGINSISVALGTDSGTFQTPAVYPVGGTGGANRLTTGDVDGDGDADILTSTVDFSASSHLTTLINNGSGVFAAMPQFSDTSANLARLMLADVNTDGDLDMAATNQTGVIVVRFGNGDGTFQATQRLPGLPTQVRMFFEDFTEDGVPDLGVNTVGAGTAEFGVIVNDAEGNLGVKQVPVAAGWGPLTIATADFNKDGHTDIVTGNESAHILVSFGDGAGFPITVSLPVTRVPRLVLAGDVNNDGNTDIFAIIQNSNEQVNRTWVSFGNGNGTFHPAVEVPLTTSFSGARMAALTDVNNDGLLDMVVPSVINNRVLIHRGIGNGSFAFESAIDIFSTVRSVTSGDFNNDGLQDIAALASSVHVYLGNRTWTPEPIGTFPAGQTSSHISSADIDGDGLLDLVTTSDTIGGAIGNPGKLVVLFGAGKGGFDAPREFIVGRGATQAAVADFDGDGNKDIAVANAGYNFGFSGAETRVSVIYGDGQRNFPRVSEWSVANYPRGIAAFDFDSDGDTDIITGDWGQDRMSLVKNICLPQPAASFPAVNAGPDATVAEGDGSNATVNVNVTLQQASALPVKVRYRTAPFLGIQGLAEAPAAVEEELAAVGRKDYIPAAGELVFAPGETSKMVEITIRGDLIDEFDERIALLLFDARGAAMGDRMTVVTIVDNDAPPAVSVGDLSSAEGNSGASQFAIPVTVSTVSEKPVTVQYVMGGGTADELDYVRTAGTYTLPAGAAAGAIPVNVNGDLAVEPDETFLLDISEPANATLGNSRSVVTIANDDAGGSVQFGSDAYAAAETTGFSNITVTRTGGNGGGVTVRFRTQAGTATPGQDYVEKTATVTFGDNETSKVVQVEFLRDGLDEPDETLNLVLDSVQGAVLGTPAAAVLTIQDSDDQPDLTVSDGTVTEGDSGTREMQLWIRLSRPTQRAVTVGYSTQDLTATAGSDYVAESGTFTVPPGVTRAAILITVNGDTQFEPDEMFQLNLANAVNANMTDNQAIGRIANDEANPNASVELVSVNPQGNGSGNLDSYDATVNVDGSVVAFESNSTNLTGSDTNGAKDVFARNLTTGVTSLVSINAAGTASGNCESRNAIISADGRYVAFESCASDLLPTATWLLRAVYIRDLQTNQTRIVSVNSSGTALNGEPIAISANGRFVVFQTRDQNVTNVPDAANFMDVFVRDMEANVTHAVTVNRDGTGMANANSGNVALGLDVKITADGRYVLFPSDATDLVSITHGGTVNLFVRDLQTQSTAAVTVNSGGTQLVGGDRTASISDDGRYVAFTSGSASVAAPDTDTGLDVFRRDMQGGVTTLVSVNAAGDASSNGTAKAASASADGRYIAFDSSSSDLTTSPDSNSLPDIYWRDMTAGITKLISANSSNTNSANSFSESPMISGNGQTVMFRSAANDLIPGGADNNALIDLYLREVVPGVNTLVSANQSGTSPGNKPTYFGALAAGGYTAAFWTEANNLVPFDTNGFASDVYAMIRVPSLVIPTNHAPFDLDGDRRTDVGIYRAAAGEWWYLRSSDGGNRAFGFGSATDKIVPVDFTGDGKTDVGFWRPSTGFWYVMRSEDNTFYGFPFGAEGDIPVPGDYDADGKADAAVFRAGSWYILQSSNNATRVDALGTTGDRPVTADYDGDGKSDIAIYRPTGSSGAGEWWINMSTAGLRAVAFGTATDKAVPGDYTGDGKADIAIWRPSTGFWYVIRSEDFSFYGFPFGADGDVPAPGDYDGDGRFDAAVFRSGTWYIERSTAGQQVVGFGAAGDTPVANAFVR